MIQNQVETERDLRAALALEQERREGRAIPAGAHWPRALIYSDRVRYVEQLRRYRAVLGAEQILVLIYDDFLRDNEGTLRQVLRFLEVDEDLALAPVKANPTVGVRSLRLAAMWRALRAGEGALPRAARRTLKALTSARLRREVLYPLRRRVVYAQAPVADPALMAELRSRFKPEVLALGEYLDRDLVKLWGYDTIV